LKHLDDKVTADIENLSKDNIDAVILKASQIQRVLYKVNKYQVGGDLKLVREAFRVISEGFLKVAKKEEMAAKVLSHDVLVKFKALKESLLHSVILCKNLLGKETISEYHQILAQIFESKSIDLKLKVKTLIPQNDFKKVGFGKYYETINEGETHSLILRFIIETIVSDEKAIINNWNLIEQGLSMIKAKNSFFLEQD
jgi:hypothetical protein